MTGPVRLREVGPRDGLQMVKTVLPAEAKIEWCERAASAGIPEIEATSFVPAKIVPQFADADAVAEGVAASRSAQMSALVVNLKGAIRAFDAGFGKVNYVVSASEAHSQANARRTTDEALEEFDRIVAERAARGLAETVELSPGVATAFGCTLQGEVPEARVHEVVDRLAASGADEIMVADTIGYAHPAKVERLLGRIVERLGALPVAAHFHDTRGLGLANVTAAARVGVRRFDASLAGLGGCPFAPGATGNVNLEDCVYLLEELGFSTGVDLDALLHLRETVEGWLPGERFTGSIARVGLPKTYRAEHVAS